LKKLSLYLWGYYIKMSGPFYRFGEEPVVGSTYHAFRDFDALQGFLDLTGEENKVPIYEIEGLIVEDDGFPDGLQVLVSKFGKVEEVNY
jgi:hypothetical protein